MRALLNLNPRRDTEYQQDYNHNMRGYLYQLLEDEYPDVHGNHKEIPFTFSNFFPPTPILDDETKVIIASHNREYLSEVAHGISKDEEINIGEMPFWLDSINVFDVSADNSGKLRTEHGVYCTVESDRNQPTYWKEKHGVDTFKTRIEESLDWKVDHMTRYDSNARDFPVFNTLHLRNTYARPVNIETDSEITVVLSDWKLEYDIRTDMHRKYINLALNTGIGWKNTLGFGFVNKI